MFQERRTGRGTGLSEVPLELIDSGEVEIYVIAEICQRVLNRFGFGMPVVWGLRIVVGIFKWKGYIRNCSCYRAVKLFQNGMKVVERVLEKRLFRIVIVNEMQCSFMPDRSIIDDVFILRRLQEEYHAKGKSLYVFSSSRESS